MAMLGRLTAAILAATCLLGAAATPASARTTTPLDLALRFQPHLFFDSAERWRPVDVDAFLAEPGHQVCSVATGAPVCAPLTSIAQLAPPARYLDLRGRHANGSDAAAPDIATCGKSKPRLLDCDEHGRSKIYAHVSRSGRRIAIDYWWFLRYNAFSIDLHEGDWEGVTVIVDAAGRRVKEVHYAAHSSVWRYPGSVPTLDAGRHPRVYVARGGHAAYPRPCIKAPCQQTQSPLAEARSNGRSAWVDDTATACARRCVRLLPEIHGAPASWDAWNGYWGLPSSAIFPPPRTPADQARYQTPFAAMPTSRRTFA